MKHSCCPNAIAKIRGGIAYPNLYGLVSFFHGCDGIVVEVEVFGLPKTDTGFFAFHIHEGGDCTGDGFPNTDGHFNPSKSGHPHHAGDLPPLLGNDGIAYMKVFTNRFRIDEVIGRTVIVHIDPDDFRTQPSGNAGTKIACGVIQKV